MANGTFLYIYKLQMKGLFQQKVGLNWLAYLGKPITNIIIQFENKYPTVIRCKN